MSATRRQGIVHVVGPEQGFTLPGTTIVCGDSHTSTHGAFGALAHGIGTCEVEHVLATQTLIQSKAKNMLVRVDGTLPEGVTAKDIILAIIGEIGTAGGTGHVIEYAGEAIEALSMEGRMTVCNMSIEGGARAGLIAPDEKTFDYIKGRPRAPKGGAFEVAKHHWEKLYSDEGAYFDRIVGLKANELPPIVSWGTSPEQVVSVAGRVPVPSEIADETKRKAAERSLDYMGLKGGEKITDIALDRVFIGSCTNGRIEDLRAVAKVVEGRKVSESVRAMIVPGSGLVKAQAEAEGPRQDLQGRRLRVARARLLDVPRHEPRSACPARALRLDLQPQFRGAPGPARPHPSGLAANGGGGGACRPLRRHPHASTKTSDTPPLALAHGGNARGVETACRRLGEETPRRSLVLVPVAVLVGVALVLAFALVPVAVPVPCQLPFQLLWPWFSSHLWWWLLPYQPQSNPNRDRGNSRNSRSTARRHNRPTPAGRWRRCRQARCRARRPHQSELFLNMEILRVSMLPA